MDELYKALVGVGIAAAGVLTTILTLVGTYAVQYLSARRDIAIAELKEKAADRAVAATEEKARGQKVDKPVEALQLADSATPKSIVITPDDIRAGVTRLRASLADPNIGSPSQRPPPGGD